MVGYDPLRWVRIFEGDELGRSTLLSGLAATFVPSLYAQAVRELRLLEVASRHRLRPPPILIDALVAGEDRRFWRHKGFDVIAMARAAWSWASSGALSGASTIEQQLVRTLTHRYERTLTRKLREVLLAAAVSPLFEKELLASLYLRIGYFGWRMNGFEQACSRLGFDAGKLSPEEASQVVAALRWPLPHQPSQELLDAWERRARHIVNELGKAGK